MLIIVSPAKKLDFETKAPTSNFTQPLFLDKSQLLINDLKKCSHSEISKLMKLSDNLSELNVERYKKFKTPFNLTNAKQAMFAFKGDTYVGLDPESMNSKEIDYAQKHLRILSGLYGLISPLDLVQPYRLEMGTKFPCQGSQNLYQYWKETLTTSVNELLQKEKTLVNLASKEYFSALDFNQIDGEIITPVFKEKKNGEYKIISFCAKKARGMMSRYIIANKCKKPADLLQFNSDGYQYIEKFSSSKEPVYCRG